MTGAEQAIQTLIRKAQDGDEHAFGIVYTEYVTPVYRYIVARVRHRDTAEDLTQTVFLKAWESLGTFHKTGAPFLSYLYVIARHAIIDFSRKKREESVQDIDAVAHGHIGSVEHDVAMREQQENIWSLLERLSDEQQDMLVLRFMNGVSTKEIAMLIGKSEEAVRQAQCRALKTLRGYMDTL